jgi:hypothetical protein
MATQTHTVATDALATLGTIIDERAGRDAIHLAVEPVVAVEKLYPGQHVGFVDGGVGGAGRHIGIVDPFIAGFVAPGQRFWLVVYPRTITSLRHVWEHPAFTSPTAQVDEQDDDPKAASERWLRNYAAEIDEGFNTLVEAADDWVRDGSWFYGARTGDYFGKFEGESTHPDFWKHYQVYRGVVVPEAQQHSFFTCSC